MRKRVICIAVIAAFALIGGWNIYQNQTSTTLSDVALSNIEALTGGEGSSFGCKSTTRDIVCYYSGHDKIMGLFYRI